MKVSVIIPFYNVQKFIQRCVCSLMEQTLQEVEFIFIDDASPDTSRQIILDTLNKYPERIKQVQILTHEINKGLPAARNTGLKKATGEYIFHCDSDDFVEPDMLTRLYEKAKEENADFIWCDWYLSYNNSERYMTQPNYCSVNDTVKGLLSGTMKFNVWNKLVKSDLYKKNRIEFPCGHSMGEDLTMIRLAACAEKVAYVPKAFYHYVRINEDAMTLNYSEKHLLDIKYNVDLTLKFLNQHACNFSKEQSFFLLNIKYPFLISDNWNAYRQWNEWYPEANHYILQNDNSSLRSRFIQWCACKKLYAIVWLHYIIVYRIIYRMIYN